MVWNFYQNDKDTVNVDCRKNLKGYSIGLFRLKIVALYIQKSFTLSIKDF
jgi:hypothetical protein